MSQYAPQAMPARPQTNGLAVAGFVVSLVGLLFTSGMLSPIGLIISLFALGRQPRGFAIWGVVLGAIGVCGWGILWLTVGAAVLVGLGILAAVMLSEAESLQIGSDMGTIAVAVTAYEKENSVVPAELRLLDLDRQTLIDPWGNAYAYHLLTEPPGFDIVSAGTDGKFATPDDVKFTDMGDTWHPGGFVVQSDEDGGTVRITLGGRGITASGDDEGGEVTIDLGDREVRIVGNDDGGSVTVEPPAVPDPPAPAGDSDRE